jgi:hypothetical protein
METGIACFGRLRVITGSSPRSPESDRCIRSEVDVYPGMTLFAPADERCPEAARVGMSAAVITATRFHDRYASADKSGRTVVRAHASTAFHVERGTSSVGITCT